MIRLGKKQIQLLTKWGPSASLYGAALGVGICYATDWKLVLQYLPYYNGKFKTEE